ncbi:MAG: hypothetical protein WC600_01090 [Desulfobaccales bacterium]
MSLKEKAQSVWAWLAKQVKAAYAAVKDMIDHTLTDREFEVIKRMPPAIAASAITVVAINMANTGVVMSIGLVAVLGALFVVSLLWSTNEKVVVPAIKETVISE